MAKLPEVEVVAVWPVARLQFFDKLLITIDIDLQAFVFLHAIEFLYHVLFELVDELAITRFLKALPDAELGVSGLRPHVLDVLIV